MPVSKAARLYEIPNTTARLILRTHDGGQGHIFEKKEEMEKRLQKERKEAEKIRLQREKQEKIDERRREKPERASKVKIETNQQEEVTVIPPNPDMIAPAYWSYQQIVVSAQIPLVYQVVFSVPPQLLNPDFPLLGL